jgi:8-oxo-dGTP diphosphatase
MNDDKWISAGGVVLDSLEPPYRVYVCKPSNGYGPWSFPKGRVDKGETIASAAIREVQEESGIDAEIIPSSYLGTGKGAFTVTHYYVMLRSGQIGAHDYETEEVRLVTFDEARSLFESDENMRDVMILRRAIKFIDSLKHEGDKMSESLDKRNTMLNELHTNLLGKIFVATLGAWLVGKVVNTKIRGTNEQVNAVSNALLASRRFQEELQRPGATVESVVQKLNVKHMSAAEFERVFQIPWPL